MNAKSRRLLFLTLIAGLAALVSGCSTVRVQAWERDTLSEYSLRPERDPLAQAMGEHTFFSREATAGGRGVGGSGCGCN